MEPLLVIIVPGILGGVLFALVLSRLGGAPDDAGDASLRPPSTGMINMAHIRVAGFGGLGMVAMAVTVAVFVPRIRLTMAIALVLGGAMAAALIAFRRRQGPLGSHIDPGAHSMFPMDAAAAPSTADSTLPQGPTQALAPLPARP